jgi:subtilisin family serine protease
MATPHVSGVAALVWRQHQACTNQRVREALTSTALDLGVAGRDNAYGFGLVQASDANAALASFNCGDGSSNPGESPGSCKLLIPCKNRFMDRSVHPPVTVDNLGNTKIDRHRHQ